MYGRWRGGRSFDLGRMTLRELLGAYATHPAIHLYLAFALLSGGLAVHWAEGALRPLLGRSVASRRVILEAECSAHGAAAATSATRAAPG
jgi:hypothetical protein